MRVGDIVADRFVLEAEVARSDGRVVYRGWDLDTDTPVAVKILSDLDDERRVRFEREATLLASTQLAGVVRYAAHGSIDDGSYFLVMEWLEGETLAERLERRGLSVAESVTMVRAMCRPLGVLHAKGLIHRDLKPANLVFTGERPDQITVIDLGLARPTTHDASMRITSTGEILGTVGYMSPEQVRGHREISPAADVFAIACILYRCLTGYAAFAGDNRLAVLYKILVGEPAPLPALCPECPPELVTAVQRMLAKDPAERPRDASAVLELLAGVGELPDGERRRNPVGDETTRVMARTMQELAVLVVDCADPRLAQTLAEARDGVHSERTSDGRLVFTLGSGAELADLRCLATLALDAVGLVPRAVMALGLGPDRAGSLLERVTRAAMFADDNGVRIAVDPDVVARLGDGFHFERASGAWLLQGRKPAS